MTSVVVNTYTHSVTYVAENILKSLKDIIRLSGLDPTNFIGEWEFESEGHPDLAGVGDLLKVVLEIYDPASDGLIRRWDIGIAYGWSSGGDGSFWTDTDSFATPSGRLA